MKKSIIIRIAIVVALILVIVLGRMLFFYSGSYTPSPGEEPGYEFTAAPAAPVTDFTDVYEKGEGVVLIDTAHENDFTREELDVLILRLVSRGLTVKFLTPQDDLEKELLGVAEEEQEEEKRKAESPEEENPPETNSPNSNNDNNKEKKPARADAFVIVSPRDEFSNEEIKFTDNFTSQGGKLLLIADPTRDSDINSLSLKFGIIFEPDYLYNMKEHDLNYRNIFVSEFADSVITKNLKKIALYTAGSISSANSSIAFVSEGTLSNVIETRKRLSPIALTQEGEVLAVYDLTFLTEPYNGSFDNNRLIANIADWLMPPAKKTLSK
ncbi:MAG: hypothetical protein HYX80_04455 [Chloroflexi bacterium]|nr:hypothetical protein [Chloroflexota bacterium]